MLEKSFGLLFYLKPSKNRRKNERYIYLRITVDGVQKEISTKRLWELSRWNVAIGRATGNKEDARNLNAYLDSLYSKRVVLSNEELGRIAERQFKLNGWSR